MHTTLVDDTAAQCKRLQAWEKLYPATWPDIDLELDDVASD